MVAYFESTPPFPEGDKRQFGYSRDQRSDCVQVVIALIVTPEGFPLAYEVLPGNTADKTTLRAYLKKSPTNTVRPTASGGWIGAFPPKKSSRKCGPAICPWPIWWARSKVISPNWKRSSPPGLGSRCARGSTSNCWPKRANFTCWPRAGTGLAKIAPAAAGTAQTPRLAQLRATDPLKRDELLLKLGAAKAEAGRTYRLVNIQIPSPRQPFIPQTFSLALNLQLPPQRPPRITAKGQIFPP